MKTIPPFPSSHSCIGTHEDNAENRLKETFFVVEATDTEQFMFWQDYAKESPIRRAIHPEAARRVGCYPSYSFEQINPGWLVTVGKIGKRPCCISVS